MAIRDEIQIFADEMNIKFIDKYDKLGLRASGKWAKELENKIEDTQRGFRIKWLGTDYTIQLEGGRGKNKNEGNIKRFVGWAGILSMPNC